MSSKGFLSQEVIDQQRKIFKVIGLVILCAYFLLFVVETHFFREKIAQIVVGQTTASLKLLSMDGDLLGVQRTLDGVVQPFKESFPISVIVTKITDGTVVAQTTAETHFYSLIQRQTVELQNIGLFEPVRIQIDIDISRLAASSLAWAIVIALFIFAILAIAQKAISRGASDLLKPAEEFLIWFEKATENNLIDTLSKPAIPKYLLSLENNITHVLTRLRDLNRQIIEAEKNRAQLVLSRQVAHDIRAPVAALKVALGQIKEGPSDESRQLMASAISRVAGIADDLLLNGTEIDQDSFEYFRASEAVQAIIAEKQMTSSGCEFNLHIEEELVIFGSKPYFLRAISNIINNSVEAREKETIRITVTVGKTLLTIEDNGRGMSPQVLESLQTKGDNTTKTYGFGLGFSGAKDLLSKMGFTVEIQSVEGQGTKVTLYQSFSQ